MSLATKKAATHFSMAHSSMVVAAWRPLSPDILAAPAHDLNLVRYWGSTCTALYIEMDSGYYDNPIYELRQQFYGYEHLISRTLRRCLTKLVSVPRVCLDPWAGMT